MNVLHVARQRIGDIPIKTKLTWANMLITGAALLIALTALLVWELSALRLSMVRNLSTAAQIAGRNSAAAILFDDPEAADNTLAALNDAPNIRFAGVYTTSAIPFARYQRPGAEAPSSAPAIPEGQPEVALFEPDSLTLARPIVFQGKLIGRVVIVSDLSEVNERLKRYGWILGGVLAISLLAAWLLSLVFQRTTAQPIMQLARTARSISQEKQFSVRAPATGNRDEIGVLIDAFNEMLSGIQDRDAALHQAHERLNLALRAAGAGTWSWSAGETAVTWDEHMYPLAGLRPQGRPRSFDDILISIDPQDRDRARKAILEGTPGADTLYVELRTLWPDGSIHWLVVRGRVFRDNEGRPVRMAGVCWDISERKAAEEDRQKFVSLIEQSDDFIAIVGHDGRFLYVNRAGRELAGLDATVVEHASIVDLYPKDSRKKFGNEILPPLLRGEGNWVGETQIVHLANGQTIDAVMNLFPVINPDTGGMLCLALVLRDISQRKQLEDQLRQAQRLESIGQLAGGVAHDFGNLLTVISGFAQLIAIEFPVGHDVRTSADEIRRAADRAGTLTRQLLAFGRQQGALEQDIALNELVRNTEKMLHRLIGENVNLVLSLEDNAGYIRADRGQIEQVIVNLVINARDAMPAGGPLAIETTRVYVDEEFAQAHLAMRTGEYLMLSVVDSGTGMSPEVQRRIFEPFFTTKETGKGTGLGLAMVYGIVKNSRGSIVVQSEPGQGTTFRLYFPAVTPSDETDDIEPAVEAEPGGNETILLAEDEDGLRRYVTLILQQQGYRVVSAANGREGMEIVYRRNEPFDLLLSDVVMPEMGGVDLAAHFARVYPSAPVLYMSGYAHRARVEEDLGTNLIQKPFAASALLLRIRRALDGRTARKSTVS